MLFKGFHRILIKCGEKNNIRTVFRIEHAHHFQTANTWHLDIEKQHIRAQFMHRADGLNGIRTFPHNLNVALLLQQDPQIFPR
ncbi:hypothetical protein D3C81_2007660 [compost metagenome]